MKSTVEDLSKIEKKLTIEVPAEAVQNSFKKAYAEVQKTAQLKGFRKGKAPIGKIKEIYSDRVTPDVLNDLVDQSYRQALSEHSLTPIDMPKVEIGRFSEDQGLEYSATLETRPEVDLKNYENLKVQREVLEISEEKVSAVLEDIRQSRAQNVPVLEDRAAQNGDVAVIDFEGFIGEEPLAGGAGQDHKLELGANQFIPGFEEGVVGMKVGTQKDLNLKFPEEYHAKEISGKDVLFKVNLKGLEKKELPELTDEFAKEYGEHESLEALKTAIREDIRIGEESRINNEMKDRILKLLVKNNPVEVPRSMVEKQKQHLVADLQQRMQQQGMSQGQFEEYKSKWEDDFENTASQMVQSSFLIGALAEKHDLHANDGDFEEKLKEYGEQMNIEVDRLRDFYGKPEQRQRLDFQLTEDKVVDFILSTANVEEVSKEKLKG